MNSSDEAILRRLIAELSDSWDSDSGADSGRLENDLTFGQKLMVRAFNELLSNSDSFVSSAELCEVLDFDYETQQHRLRSCMFQLNAQLQQSDSVRARIIFNSDHGYKLSIDRRDGGESGP